MANLLHSTLEVMSRHNKHPSDIKYIGDIKGNYLEWDQFFVAANTEHGFDNDQLRVAIDLMIIFNDNSWMTRQVFTGTEWWEYVELPSPGKRNQILDVMSHHKLPTLEAINAKPIPQA